MLAPDAQCSHCDAADSLEGEWVKRYQAWRAICTCCAKVTWLDGDGKAIPTPSPRDVSGQIIDGP